MYYEVPDQAELHGSISVSVNGHEYMSPSPEVFLERIGASLASEFAPYCAKVSSSGCNLFRKRYSMAAPTRKATASAMTSDQTTPWKPFM